MTASRALAAVLLVALVAGCGATSGTPSPSPPAESPSPADSQAAAGRCPDLQFDASASLDPTFDGDSLPGDRATEIGSTFVDALTGLYVGDPDADPCAVFTGPGLESAIALDPRLGPALAGTSRLDTDLVFRIASDHEANLGDRPPTVPIDVVFDVPAGATTTDVASGATDTSERVERVAFRVTFAFDGTRWLADAVTRVPQQDAASWALPTPVAQLKACKGFRDDPDGARFDDAAGTTTGRDPQRRWCADGGKGDALPSDLVTLWTRFPCDRGHVAVLTIGWPLGTPDDPLDRHQYVRDPTGEALDRGWLHEAWQRGVKLPDGAEDTGWTNGNMDLFVDPGDVESAVYVRTGGRYERWPRGDDPSVTDCN